MLVRVHTVLNTSDATARFAAVLQQFEIVATAAPARGNFWERVSKEPSDIVLVSRGLLAPPVEESLQSILALSEEPDVIVVSDDEDAVDRAKLLAGGSTAVLCAAVQDELLAETLKSFIERREEFNLRRAEKEVSQPEQSLADFDSTSPVMKSFMRMVRRVVEPDSSLLILGDTGVGKERLARAIHAAGPRARGPFIPVNCAAFPESLLEGELFGYEEGAFTGAAGDRRGYFEMAHGGTIFLDEIGELHPHLQVKLLRVLQERRIQPLGSEQEIEIDVRVFAATNRDLEEEIAQRRFRRDLYYRLGVVTLEIPPLKEHPEDIPGLIERYLFELAQRMNRPVDSVAPDALDALCRYHWPGNIRELINVVERAIILCDGTTLTLDALPGGLGPSRENTAHVNHFPQASPTPDASNAADLLQRNWNEYRDESLAAMERQYLTLHLQAASGRLNELSRRTGIPSRTLYKMLRTHHIDKRQFRNPPEQQA